MSLLGPEATRIATIELSAAFGNYFQAIDDRPKTEQDEARLAVGVCLVGPQRRRGEWFMAACPTCDGSGKCPRCGGSGSISSFLFFSDKCPLCGGQKVCPTCKGSGKKKSWWD